MTKTITFNELRKIKDSLPDGSTCLLVVLDDTTIFERAMQILAEAQDAAARHA